MPDIGEIVVGAWLTQVKKYDFVVYNQAPGRDLPEEVAPAGLAGVSAQTSQARRTAPTILWSEVLKVHRTRAGIRAPRGGNEVFTLRRVGSTNDGLPREAEA